MVQVARPPAPTQRYRAVVAYDGTRYYGFQRQAGDTPTIQGALERALERVTRQTLAITGAGRTDSGVHATGQVIAFEAAWRHPTQALWRAINANLPDDITLQALTEARADFHPRFDAHSRKYTYTLYVAPVRQPLLNNLAWQVPTHRPLDVAAMQRAAELLVGTHDFATFGTPPQGDSTVRTVMQSVFEPLPGPLFHSADTVQMLRYTIEANAFLYRMVRRTVGTLVRVGTGHLSVADFAAALRAADGDRAAQTAPACGLCLISVSY